MTVSWILVTRNEHIFSFPAFICKPTFLLASNGGILLFNLIIIIPKSCIIEVANVQIDVCLIYIRYRTTRIYMYPWIPVKTPMGILLI